MAETFVTVYQGAGGRIDLGYDYTQNIENNSTTLTVKAYVVKTNSSYYSYRQSAINFKLTVNGIDTNHSWTFDFRNMNLNQRYLIATATRTFTHATDGTKSNVPASVYCATGTSGLGTISGSTSIAIATIPRASQPTLNDDTVYMRDQAVTISTNRASSAFTHILRYSFGNASGIIATGVGTAYAWVPPISLAGQIPNATSGVGTITCETYTGSTLIGTKTVSIRLYVPADIVPTVSIGKSGLELYQSQYVQGKSKVEVTLSASGTYGSTIKSRSTTIKSGTNVISSSSSNTFVSGVINYSGTITIETTVTDSRGRTSSASTTIIVTAYTGPQITAFKAYRANSDGSANPQGTYIRITGSASISPINNTNTKTTILRYRVKGSSTWINATSNTSSYTPSLAATVTADVNSSFEVQIYTGDYFSSSEKMANIGTAFVLMDFHNSGTGMAIGKVAEYENAFEVYLRSNILKFHGIHSYDWTTSPEMAGKTNLGGWHGPLPDGVTQGYMAIGAISGAIDFMIDGDVFVQEGRYKAWNNTSCTVYQNANGWAYKFENGLMICTMYTENVPVSSNNNVTQGITTYHKYATWTYPVSFVSRPEVFVSADSSGWAMDSCGAWGTGSVSTVYGISSMADVTIPRINVMAIGRWK